MAWQRRLETQRTVCSEKIHALAAGSIPFVIATSNSSRDSNIMTVLVIIGPKENDIDRCLHPVLQYQLPRSHVLHVRTPLRTNDGNIEDRVLLDSDAYFTTMIQWQDNAMHPFFMQMWTGIPIFPFQGKLYVVCWCEGYFAVGNTHKKGMHRKRTIDVSEINSFLSVSLQWSILQLIQWQETQTAKYGFRRRARNAAYKWKLHIMSSA